MSTITVFRVTAPAIDRRGRPCLLDVPIEAASAEEAARAVVQIAKRARVSLVFLPLAVRDRRLEDYLDEWSREVFARASHDSKAEGRKT